LNLGNEWFGFSENHVVRCAGHQVGPVRSRRAIEEKEMAETKPDGMHIRQIVSLLKYTAGHKREYVLLIVLLGFQMATYQAMAYSLRYLINDLIPLGKLSYFIYFAGAWVGAFLIHAVITLGAAHYRIFLVRTLIANVRAQIIRKLQVLSIRYFDRRGTGTTSAKMLMDMNRLQQLYDWVHHTLLEGVFGLLIAIPFLSTIDPTLTVIAFLYIPVIPLLQRIFRGMLMRHSRKLRNTNEQLSARIVDYISGIRQIRLFATEEKHGGEIIRHVEEVKNVDIRYTFAMRVLQMAIQFFSDFTPVMLWVSAGFIMSRKSGLSLGDVVAYVALVRQLLMSFRILFNSFDQIVRAAPSAAAIHDVIEHTETENLNPQITDFEIDGSIRFRDVDFSYENRGLQLQLENLNIVIPAGEKIALVGESGSGKSTFVNVLMGLYAIQKGEILFGEYPISRISLRNLRSQIAVLSQEVFLFNTSIYDNVRFANMNASREQVREACRKAEILEFIESLPEGFETHAGERGVQLSGGQRQRIGLARVFIRRPKIIILDEPSSALDVVTEQRMFETLYRNLEGRTLIVVAHRLSTIRNVDRVLVFKEGSVVEQGTFRELGKSNTLFADMLEAGTAPA